MTEHIWVIHDTPHRSDRKHIKCLRCGIGTVVSVAWLTSHPDLSEAFILGSNFMVLEEGEEPSLTRVIKLISCNDYSVMSVQNS